MTNDGHTFSDIEIDSVDVGPNRYSYYRACRFQGEEYEPGESVLVVNGKRRGRIGRLLCLFRIWHEFSGYYDNDSENVEPLQAVVCWYTKAKNLDSKLNPTKIKFDMENELIEDDTEKGVIYIVQVVRRIKIVYCRIEDPVYFISGYKYDKKLYFSCRYKVQSGRIVPRSNSTRELLATDLGFYSSDKETNNETDKCENSTLEPKFVFGRNFSLQGVLNILYLLFIPVLFIILFIVIFSYC